MRRSEILKAGLRLILGIESNSFAEREKEWGRMLQPMSEKNSWNKIKLIYAIIPNNKNMKLDSILFVSL